MLFIRPYLLTLSFASLLHNKPSLAFVPLSSRTIIERRSTTTTTTTGISMSTALLEDPPKHVVIAGAGIIGTSTAYYLAKNHGIRCTVVDPTGTIAPAASGKAGGFLALDWNDDSPTEQLTRRSFQLHSELANDDSLGADSIQYRRLTCVTISVGDSSNKQKPSGKKLNGIEWAANNNDTSIGVRSLGDESTIAQVHPKLLCQRLWEEATTLIVGSELRKGKVVGAVDNNGDTNNKCGAKLDDGSIIECDAVLFACGPWTTNIMKGVKYHSAVVPTSRVLSQCVFFSGFGDPEVYVRPDSTAYCTGFPDPAIAVKERPGEEEVRDDKIEAILQSVWSASGSVEGSSVNGVLCQEPVVKQACYLPTTNDGIPIMGRLSETIAGSNHCYVAAGHSCWGILLGPATGESMASLIATGKETSYVNLDVFDPSRYPAMRLT
jgi:glycine/D-amino acid oxidase-like deaminating enzyme